MVDYGILSLKFITVFMFICLSFRIGISLVLFLAYFNKFVDIFKDTLSPVGGNKCILPNKIRENIA